MSARRKLAELVGMPLTWHVPIDIRRVSPELAALATLADNLEVEPLKVLQWSGWVCGRKTRPYRVAFLPLTPILDHLGEQFTLQLYSICQTFSTTRRHAGHFAVRAMATLLSSTETSFSPKQLQNPKDAADFLYALYECYLREGYRDGNGRAISQLVHHWRGEVTIFFEEYLFPAGLVARPSAGLPTPRSIDIGGQTNIKRTDGILIHDKLLTPVPLEVSDQEALQLIFHKIEEELKNIKRWALHEVNRIAVLLERRRQFAKEGNVRRVLPAGSNLPTDASTDWSHPNHLKNGAATFEALGYPCYGDGSDLSAVLFPAPRTRWAHELAVPESSTLLPHCAVIVGEHPSITTAYLEQCELYDVNGKLAGVICNDSGSILSGAKLRRGSEHAAEDVILNHNSSFAVDQIIQLTTPLRNFLRERGDDSWRYLLLTSGKGFGYPRRMDRLSVRTSSPDAIRALGNSFAQVLNLPAEEANGLAKRFSLTAMRASAGVIVYFKSKSVHEMATALGHVKYDSKLLDRYLPKALRQFFEERWIRIFQTGVIVQALQGSPYQLEASGFRTIEELDSFLLNHSIKLPPRPTSSSLMSNETDINTLGKLSSPRETVFGLNEEILTTLISLDLAEAESSRALAPLARYWAEIGRSLIPYIEIAGTARPDIQEYLRNARRRARADLVSKIAYA